MIATTTRHRIISTTTASAGRSVGRFIGRSIAAPNRFRPQMNANPNGSVFNATRSFSSSSSSSSSSSFFGRAWERYTKALIARPLLVKGSAASVIFFASDTATQALFASGGGDDPLADQRSLDLTRALSGAAFGVVATCWLHHWWNFLELVINKHLPAGSYGQNKLVNALAKVAADQLVGAPLYLYSYYCVTYFGTEWVDRKSGNIAAAATGNGNADHNGGDDLALASSLAKETSDRAVGMLPDTLMRHWTLWPIVHTINFYYFPIHHRVLVQNLVLIFWSGYLSHLNNGGLVNNNNNNSINADSDSQESLDDQSKIGVIQKTKTSTKHGTIEPVATALVASTRRDVPLATSLGRWR